MATDHELRVHRDWIGLLQPVGLVVSPPALLAAQAFPDKNILEEQQALLALITPPAPKDGDKNAVERPPLPLGFEALATQVLGWKPSKLAGSPSGPALPESLELVLPEFGETLRPTFAVAAVREDTASTEGAGEWMMLVQELADGTSFDEPPAEETKKWHASPQIRLERLLRETGVPIGILANGRFIRLVYAPRGESSGHVTWPVHRLGTALDRDMLSALCMLLGSARLFTLPRDQRLPHLLKESRKYQNVVSTKLAGQVLEALNELLRGFQSANEAAKGALLDATVREDPDHVYGGLLAVLLRLVFVLYAEERGLLSSSAAYVRNYSLVALFDKLRIDAGRFPDTMDQRYGAWSRLLVLFRMVHDGAKRGDLRLPPRYGHLFDPDGWAFLEGRPLRVNRVMGAPVEVPKVPDGVVLRALEKLLLLASDRLSYRALDVEQIGSVYENMMGFRLERAVEPSIGVGKEHVVVGLETLLVKKGAEREKLLKEMASVELTGKASEALKEAATIDDLVAALSRRISPLTPRTVPAGGLYLQPTDERRRSGSHYTPRELTEPIVRTTLRPILADLGPSPKPEQVLALKVCDPAMGSGAFLVETCRQLAEELVKAYDVHGRPTDIPPDEDVLLYAQRQVAQHCLYGVDKNPFAVDLGKLSLWLATLARDHAFTFLDHSIRHGDSLVGLTREQIASFHWAPEKQIPVIRTFVDKAIAEAMALRAKIPDLANSDDVREKRHLLRDADDALTKVRLVGDAIVASFFSADGAPARERARKRWETEVENWLSGRDSASAIIVSVEDLRLGQRPIPSFHWDVEFPEVFGRDPSGFDGLVGNPPYAHKNAIIGEGGSAYIPHFQTHYPAFHGYSDLGTYFVRRAESLVRSGGCWTLLCTKTITEGKARDSGLQVVVLAGSTIIAARTKIAWPSGAAVVVCAPTVYRGTWARAVVLDGQETSSISASLVAERAWAPRALVENRNLSSTGFLTYGRGFVLDPATAEQLLEREPDSRQVVVPLLSASDFTDRADLLPSQWVINFGTRSEAEAANFPGPFRWLEENAREERLDASRADARDRWWLLVGRAERVYAEVSRQQLRRVLANLHVSKHHAFAFIPSDVAPEKNVNVFAFSCDAAFAVMQSRVHEAWADRQASSLETRRRYTPTTCFVTFPCPLSPLALHRSPPLDVAGRAYYVFRHEMMARQGRGLTETYNRFHDPDDADADIARLRDLHASMDRAVLDAYGWTDLQTTCAFIRDHDEDQDGDDEPAAGRRKKERWHYRWPNDIRNEVLGRLLELNLKRAKEQSGTPPPTGPGGSGSAGKKPRGREKAKKPTPAGQGGLFGEGSE